MPIFTSIGLALGATTAASAAGIGAFGVGVAATAVGVGAAAYSSTSKSKAASAAKNAAQANIQSQNEAIARNDKAAAKLKADQDSAASQAAQSIKDRKKRIIAGSQSVYTSPLGVTGSANIAKKALLGD